MCSDSLIDVTVFELVHECGLLYVHNFHDRSIDRLLVAMNSATYCHGRVFETGIELFSTYTMDKA